jgi:hypothetical protein
MKYISKEELETKLYNLYPKDKGLPLNGGTIAVFSYAELISIMEEDMQVVEITDKEYHEREPVLVEYGKYDNGTGYAECPICLARINENELIFGEAEYCPNCGQPIKW